MKLKSLEDLFVEELRDVYHAENQLVKALPKMAKAATTPDLKTGFEQHLKETKGQVGRLEKAFKKLGLAVRGKKCMAMEGLIEEGKELIEEDAEDSVKDAGLIAAAQKVEHYEIATYGTLVTWGEQLSHSDVAALLQETLDEEKATNEKLTELAEGMVNAAADR